MRCFYAFIVFLAVGFALRDVPRFLGTAADASNDGEVMECQPLAAPELAATLDADRGRPTPDDSDPPPSDRALSATLSLRLRLAGGRNLRLAFVQRK